MLTLDRRQIVLGLLGIAVLGVIWQLATTHMSRMTTFPDTLEAGGAALAQLGDTEFWRQLRVSGFRWACGLGIAVGVGVPIGLVMGRHRTVHRVVDPLLTVMYPIPKASLILLFVLLWGTGNGARIVAIATGAIIPVIVSSYHGAAGVEERLLWSGRGLGWRGGRSMLSVVFPAALPQILNGIRIAISISIFVLVGSELLVRGSGIGNYLFNFYDVGQNSSVWGTALALAIVGWLLDSLYVAVVRFATPWMDGQV